jgi:hypothetical protein
LVVGRPNIQVHDIAGAVPIRQICPFCLCAGAIVVIWHVEIELTRVGVRSHTELIGIAELGTTICMVIRSLLRTQGERRYCSTCRVLPALQVLRQLCNGRFLTCDYRLYKLAHPQAESRFEVVAVFEEHVKDILQRALQEPHKDVRMQRATPLGLNWAKGGSNKAKYANMRPVLRHPIACPSLRSFTDRPALPTDEFWADAEDVDEEETDHELKHDGLANGVTSEALGHLPVRDFDILVEVEILALDDEEQRLLRVGVVGRYNFQGRPKAERISSVLATQLSSMSI